MTAAAKDRVTKKKLTLAEAADQFERCKSEMKTIEVELEEAKEVLLAHFEKTGRSTYKDRIVLARSTRTVLDTDKLKGFLGKQYTDFQKRIDIKSLSLLK